MAETDPGEQRREEHRLMLAVGEILEREALSGGPREREPRRRIPCVQAEKPELGSETGDRLLHRS